MGKRLICSFFPLLFPLSYQFLTNNPLFLSLHAQMRRLFAGNAKDRGGWDFYVMKTANSAVEKF